MSGGTYSFFAVIPVLTMLACAAPCEEPVAKASESSLSKPSSDEARLDIGESTLTVYAPTVAVVVCKSDADCDDGNACTRDACDFASHRCSSTLIDADGDGYAPSSLGACGRDCHDGNALVHPAQTGWFGAPYHALSGVLSFDYDCDGVEIRQAEDFGYCIGAATTEASSCTCVAGWTDVVPACGGTADFSEAGACGETKKVSKLQGCR